MGWSTHQDYERILGIVADLSNMKTPKFYSKMMEYRVSAQHETFNKVITMLSCP
jgi:hypothetical protein